MPVREPAVLLGTTFALRHVGPRQGVFPDAPGANTTVLQRNDMVSRPLPSSNIPSSPDFVSGDYILRLLDSGEGTLLFPNRNASDGIPWRERFDESGHLQFIEIYLNGELEFVGVVDQVTIDAQQVQVHLSDGWFLLRKAYERDWTVVGSPRQVAERATRVWRGLVVDDFPYVGSTIPGPQWDTSTTVQAGPLTTGASTDDPTYADLFGAPGSLIWSNASGLPMSSPATCSSSTAGTGVASHGLVASMFSFSLPTDAVPVGLEVAIESNYTQTGTANGTIYPRNPQITSGGVVHTGTYADSSSGLAFQSNAASWSYFGGPTDTWGGLVDSLTYSAINADDFGCGLQGGFEIFSGSGSLGLSVTTIRMTVWYTTSSPTTVQIRSSGGLAMSVSSTSGNKASITSIPVPCESNVWFAESSVFRLPTSGCQYTLVVHESGVPAAQVDVENGACQFFVWDEPNGAFTLVSTITPTTAATYDLRLESDGEWLTAYCNGQLVGVCRRQPFDPSALDLNLYLYSFGTAGTVVVSSAVLEAQVPFLLSDPSSPTAHGTASVASEIANGGSGGWVGFSNISVPGAEVSSSIAATETTRLLMCTGFDFSIPAAATIVGVRALVSRSHESALSTIVDSLITLIHGGAVLGGSRADTSTAWPVSDTTGTIRTYGRGITDSWDAALTPAIVNDSTFGLGIQAYSPSGTFNDPCYVWSPVTLAIYYTMPSTRQGDYMLPGDMTTYPWGGLHGRYYNDADLTGLDYTLIPNTSGAAGGYASQILSPVRSQAYGSAAPSEYAERQDAAINFVGYPAASWAPSPGVAIDSVNSTQVNFSVRWFGAIWLGLSHGDFTIGFTADDGVRVWVGKTGWGDQVIDEWYPQSAVGYTGTVVAADIGDRDGWYPIVIEYFQGPGAAVAQLWWGTIPGSGTIYTDPGGTAIVAGTFSPGDQIIPATSLTPLGCVDQRFQGISHYDMLAQALQVSGYQATCSPRRLESGEFPGQIVPRVSEGASTAIVLEPASLPRQAGEGLLNYSVADDASDFVTSLQGNGAGFPSGTTGQLQQNVYDPTILSEALFDVQGWQDFSDASFPELLQGLLNSQLGLRLTPWQSLSADPVGKPRQAFTWPLPGALAAMRWRPGDALRIHARDINVYDGTPRQMLVVQRNILPFDIASTQATFANRPRNPARTLKQGLFSASRIQRNYQRTQVAIAGNYMTAAVSGGATFGYSIVALSPADVVISATVRLVVTSGTNPSVGVQIQGVDTTMELNGPWTAFPLVLNVTQFAVPDTTNRLSAAVVNKNGSNSVTLDFVLIVDVLR